MSPYYRREYKALCAAGHEQFGAGDGCSRCAENAPLILETKEGGRALAWPDHEDPDNVELWEELL